MDNKQFVTAYRQSLKTHDTVEADKVGNLLDHAQYSTVAQLWCDPRSYGDSKSYYRAAQTVDLLRKSDFLPGLSEDKRNAATLETWVAAEQQCCATNARWWIYLDPSYISDFNIILDRLRIEVKEILGTFKAIGDPVFTNGATSSDKTGRTTRPDKINSQPVCYPKAWDCIRGNLWTCSWGRHLRSIGIEDHHGFEFRNYNEYFTVPKSALINRACCKEANAVIPYQRALGLQIAHRLKLAGNSIPDGQVRHQALAKHASIFGDYATIDISSASDTIAYNFVKAVLPPSWFGVLDSLRATHTKVGGVSHYLEKFSSMGNGFTFELETVLFLAICRTACHFSGVDRKLCSTFGDDMIVPTAAADYTVQLLTVCGFKLNARKSFLDGPFRESCGGDYFRGDDVTTVKLTEYDNTIPGLFALHNKLQRSAMLKSLADVVYHQIPLPFRALGGPVENGDLVLHSRPSQVKNNKYGTPMVRALGFSFLELDRERWCLSTQFLTTGWVKYPITTAQRTGKFSGKLSTTPHELTIDSCGSYVWTRWTHYGVNSSWLPDPHIVR